MLGFEIKQMNRATNFTTKNTKCKAQVGFCESKVSWFRWKGFLPGGTAAYFKKLLGNFHRAIFA